MNERERKKERVYTENNKKIKKLKHCRIIRFNCTLSSEIDTIIALKVGMYESTGKVLKKKNRCSRGLFILNMHVFITLSKFISVLMDIENCNSRIFATKTNYSIEFVL